MPICLNSRIIANTRVSNVSGAKLAGGYALRIGIEFNALNWDMDNTPQVLMAPARVHVGAQSSGSLGLAFPETIKPFVISAYPSTTVAVYDLLLTPGAMEAVERHRNGQGIALTIKLHGEVRRGGESNVFHDDVHSTLNVSQWVLALEQTGYGRSLLFEVPIPNDVPALGVSLERLEAAQRQFAQGRYPEVVAACRMVIEGITKELGQAAALGAATNNKQKHSRTVEERELVMRQAVMDFASLAHHPTGLSQDELFDRNAAQLMLGSTAALVSSAMRRFAAGQRADGAN